MKNIYKSALALTTCEDILYIAMFIVGVAKFLAFDHGVKLADLKKNPAIKLAVWQMAILCGVCHTTDSYPSCYMECKAMARKKRPVY